jgi:RNA polymerase sigma factor for flagellar operon FliA
MSGVFGGEYPGELGQAIGHAKRFAKVLAKLEAEGQGSTWITGRAGELRAVVSCAVQDWRSGAQSEDGARRSIVAYVEELHRGASRKLRCRRALECCSRGDAVTAVGADSVVSSALGAVHTTAPTMRAGWVDSPEVLARVRQELPRVALLARVVRRQMSSRSGVVTQDDLEAFGRAGLLDAARSYNESRGMAFRSWAEHRIRNAMLDGVRSWGPLPRGVHRKLRALEAVEGEQGAAAAEAGGAARDPQGAGPLRDAGLGAVASAIALAQVSERAGDVEDLGLTPEELFGRAELSARVREVVARLPERQRAIVEGMYFAGMTLEAAAAACGLSKSWGCRVHAEAIKCIARELREADVSAPGM